MSACWAGSAAGSQNEPAATFAGCLGQLGDTRDRCAVSVGDNRSGVGADIPPGYTPPVEDDKPKAEKDDGSKSPPTGAFSCLFWDGSLALT